MTNHKTSNVNHKKSVREFRSPRNTQWLIAENVQLYKTVLLRMYLYLYCPAICLYGATVPVPVYLPPQPPFPCCITKHWDKTFVLLFFLSYYRYFLTWLSVRLFFLTLEAVDCIYFAENKGRLHFGFNANWC